MHHFLPPFRHAALAVLLGLAQASAWAVDTPIYSIQGSGARSPLAGQTVTTTGVVTKVNNNGFFMQDQTGDGNPATSDGILVFTSTAPTVQVGQLVRLTGVVTEFDVSGTTSNPAVEARPVTELTTISGLTVLGSGFSVTPVPLTLPVASLDELEKLEGMLVTVQGPLTVSQNFFQARYGQLTLSAGRLETPTNRARAGAAAIALADANARSRLVLDDGSSLQNVNPTPFFGSNGTPRAGDTVASVTGVLDYGLATASAAGYADYKLHPVSAPVFTASNPRTAAPAAVGGNVKVASFNVLNFFTTFTNGNTASGQTGQGCTLGTSTAAGNCRGANSLAEFERQRAKIVEAMVALNADALGLMEIQNNGTVAAQNLVDALNARIGSPTYAVVPDPATGTGTDAIKVAMIYKPAKLTPDSASTSDTSAINNRPPLAQTFRLSNGEKFTLVVNHLKSKGSCPAASDADAPGNTDSGDGQGCWNAQRLAQAQALRSFVARLQTSTANGHVLMVGDFNAYAQEDPIIDLTSNGFVDQVGRFSSFGYSYVFDGAAGRLDHGISTAALSPKVTGTAHWHINADEQVSHDYNFEFKQPACATCAPDPYAATPYRSSDHDPVVIGLSLFKLITGNGSRAPVLGSVGDDLIIGGAGANTLTGGAGTNVFAYTSMRDAGDTITDFVPGKDLLDLRTLLAGLAINSPNPVATGHVRFVASGGGTAVMVDADGFAGAAAPRLLATLQGVSPGSLQPTRDLMAR